MIEPIELNGKTYVPAETATPPKWPCVINNSRLSTLTLKEDDIFLVTDILGNIPGCLPGEANTSVGLFCQDTRFLNRLELQIDGQLPILLSSNARCGFTLSVLCANPHLEKQQIGAETIGIEREMVINGGLFEELAITNYSDSSVSFELSLNFDADFVNLFEIRGWKRKQKGKLLRLLDAVEIVDPIVEAEAIAVENSNLNLNSEPPKVKLEPRNNPNNPVIESPAAEFSEGKIEDLRSLVTESEELLIVYQGLDGLVRSSRIQFSARQPDCFRGYTAIWYMELNPHETIYLGYRVQLLADNQSISKVGTPMTLMQAKPGSRIRLKGKG